MDGQNEAPKERLLEIDAKEVFLLCLKIPNEGSDFPSGDVLAPALLVKLFSVFNELIEGKFKPGTGTVSITEREAWLIRRFVSPADRDSSGVPTGILLLWKIHNIILDFSGIPRTGDLTEAQIEEEKRRKQNGPASRQQPDDNAGDDPNESSHDYPGSVYGTGEKG